MSAKHLSKVYKEWNMLNDLYAITKWSDFKSHYLVDEQKSIYNTNDSSVNINRKLYTFLKSTLSVKMHVELKYLLMKKHCDTANTNCCLAIPTRSTGSYGEVETMNLKDFRKQKHVWESLNRPHKHYIGSHVCLLFGAFVQSKVWVRLEACRKRWEGVPTQLLYYWPQVWNFKIGMVTHEKVSVRFSRTNITVILRYGTKAYCISGWQMWWRVLYMWREGVL